MIADPITTEPTADSVPLHAATWSHPALPGRVSVTLVSAPLLEAESLAKQVDGFTLAGSTPVGHSRRRAIGFPAWPVLTDPDNARHALNLVTYLERAGRRATTKPKQALDLINEPVRTLAAAAPHFLPSYFEEAARIFVRAEVANYAVQMFGKAREAERVHGLPIDLAQRHAVFEEFGYAGAVSAKELTAEAKLLRELIDEQTLTAAVALDHFTGLLVSRARAGLPPYAATLKDLATLTKAAGRPAGEAERDLLAQLLASAKISAAPKAFWKSAEKHLKPVIAARPELARPLLARRPRDLAASEWLTLLERTGALALAEPTEEMLTTLVAEHLAAHGFPIPLLTSTISRLGKDLGAAGGTVTVSSRMRGASPQLFDELIGFGVGFRVTRPGAFALGRFELNRRWEDASPHRDLTELAAHPLFRGILARELAGMGTEDLERYLASSGLVSLLRDLVSDYAEAVAGAGSVFTVQEAVNHLRVLAAVSDPSVARPARQALDAVDPAEVLAATLRLGLVEELAWPAYEQAFAEAAQETDQLLRVNTQWPDVLVHHAHRLWWVRNEFAGADTEQDLSWVPAEIDSARATGDDLLVSFNTGSRYAPEWKVAWRSDPTPRERRVWSPAMREISIDLPQGRLTGDGLINHDSLPEGSGRRVLSDGTRFWSVTDKSARELDPVTGRAGRESVPDWFAEQITRLAPQGWEIAWDHCYLMPVTEQSRTSLLGHSDGLHRQALFRRTPAAAADSGRRYLLIDAEGHEHHSRGDSLLVQRPGGGHWIGSPRRLQDLASGEALPAEESRALGNLPAALWHRLRPRHPEASVTLRALDAASVTDLLAVASTEVRADRAEDDGVDRAPRSAAAGRLLGLAADDPLSAAVARVGYSVGQLADDLRVAEPAPVTEPPQPTDHGLDFDPAKVLALRHVPGTDIVFHPKGLLRTARHLGLIPEIHIPAGDDGYIHGWLDVVRSPAALLAQAQLHVGHASALEPLRHAARVLARFAELQIDLVPGDGDVLTEGAALLRGRGKHVLIRTSDALGRIDGSTVTVLGPLPAYGPAGVVPEAAFDALADALAAGRRRTFEPGWGEELARLTGRPVADSALILADFPHFHSWDKNFLPKQLRTELGLKVADAKEARDRLRRTEEYDELRTVSLAAGVAPAAMDGSDPFAAPDLAALARVWALPDNGVPAELTALVPDEYGDLLPGFLGVGERYPMRILFEGCLALWLAEHLPTDSPHRELVAAATERLHTELHGGPLGITGFYRRLFAVPEGETFAVDGIRVTDSPDRVHYDLLTLDVAALSPANWDQLGRNSQFGLVLDRDHESPLLAAAEVLRTPWSGELHDPRVATPDLVEEIATARGLSAEAATYWLQLLALLDPTDTAVRDWNGWKKKDLDAAAAELLAQDLVLEAKRAKAGRTRFLPGAWLTSRHWRPLEAWKAEAWGFRIHADGTPGAANDNPPAPRPLPEMFRRAWARVQAGDGPAYEELKTDRTGLA